jgi:hypothetical protein
MLAEEEHACFVDNEMVFAQALAEEPYGEHVTDEFAGDFGDTTPKGNRLFAEDVGPALLRDAMGWR